MHLAVVKQGPKCNAQLAYLDRLVNIAPDSFPRVVARWDNGFAMEMLRPYEPHEDWPRIVENAASRALWERVSVVSLRRESWQSELHRTLGLTAPAWSWRHVETCATHGDLTMCNTMTDESGGVVFIDPVYPERVPSIRHVDQARILQSMLGWEIMTGRQTKTIDWDTPNFLLPKTTLHDVMTTLFWTAIVMARIAASATVTDSERGWARHLYDQLTGVLPQC